MQAKDKFFSKKRYLNTGENLLDLSVPKVMGIVNITPDSFYSNSRYSDEEEIVNRVQQILDEGGSIIDLGAYSSRPGAKDVSFDKEWTRLSFALKLIRKEFSNIPISVDTFRAEIAERVADEFGVKIINDISAGEMDDKMFQMVANKKLTYIMMHMKGTPQDMQINPVYEHLLKEIIQYFAAKVEALKFLGVSDIVLDPGFGFGKTIEHNYQLLRELNSFDMFELPVLVGVSRKSMIYKYLENTPEDALNGTSVIHTLSLERGADILRVHDVKEAVECIQLVEKMKKA